MTLRQFAVIFVTLLAISVNALANALPINGIETGQVSDKYFTLFTPAGYVFAIWGVILGMLAYMVYQALPSQRTNPRLRSGWWYVFGNLANTVWIFFWHYEQLLITVGLILILLFSLVMAYLRLAPARQIPGLVSRRVVDYAPAFQHLYGLGDGGNRRQCGHVPCVGRMGRWLPVCSVDSDPAAGCDWHRPTVSCAGVM